MLLICCLKVKSYKGMIRLWIISLVKVKLKVWIKVKTSWDWAVPSSEGLRLKLCWIELFGSKKKDFLGLKNFWFENNLVSKNLLVEIFYLDFFGVMVQKKFRLNLNFWSKKFVRSKEILWSNIFWVKKLFCVQKNFWIKNCLGRKIFWKKNFCGQQFLCSWKKFVWSIFLSNDFYWFKNMFKNILGSKKFLGWNIFLSKRILGQNFFRSKV